VNRVIYVIVLVALFAVSLAGVVSMAGISVQYTPLASYDFLSASELHNFMNITLDGKIWNVTLTKYSVSNGILNITNKDDMDALLVMPRSIDGYAEVKFAGDGGVMVVNPLSINGSSTHVMGYEIIRKGTSYTVYFVNGTNKDVLASTSSSSDTVVVTVMDGKIRFGLQDGSGIYEANGFGLIALAAPPDSSACFDRVALYGKYLASQNEVDLGSATIEKGKHIAIFKYDLSGYKSIKSAKLVVEMTGENDPYARWVLVLINGHGLGTISTITNAFRWPNPVPDDLKDKYDYIVVYRGTISFDVTSYVSSQKTGEIIVGVQTSLVPWNVHVKLVIDGESGNGGSSSSTSAGSASSGTATKSIALSDNRFIYLAAGAGILILFIVIVAAFAKGGRRRGLTFMLVPLLILLVIGGIVMGILAWLHPEYLVTMAMGLGAIAFLVLFLLIASGKRIPNPIKHSG